MMKLYNFVLAGVAIAVLGLACFAKTPVLIGKIVAYDPLLHAGKNTAGIANREIVILETQGQKTKYVKLEFVSFGTTQIDPKYFDGAQTLTVKALRDRTCDEGSPTLVGQVGLDQRSGTYLLTDAFKKSSSLKIKTLECYDAATKK
jgi:hypothetical protein